MSNLLPKSLFSASTLKREPVEESLGKKNKGILGILKYILS